jgi:hypothetical protein
LEGDELRVGYDMETEFPAGLTRVKAKTLSGIRSGSWVRSGPGRVTRLSLFSLSGRDRVSRVMSDYGSGNRVKAFSLSGAIGLAGLARVKLG